MHNNHVARREEFAACAEMELELALMDPYAAAHSAARPVRRDEPNMVHGTSNAFRVAAALFQMAAIGQDFDLISEGGRFITG
jgi:hypothetical protein